MSCPNAAKVSLVIPEGTCLPVEGCPDGPPVEVTGTVTIEQPVAVTIADCADVVEGCLNDAANLTGAAGTISGKIRGILSILANVWDSVRGTIKGDMYVNGGRIERSFYAPNFDDGLPTSFVLAQAGTDYLRYTTFPLIMDGPNFVRGRTPSVFKTAQAVAAGNTALWTPAAGKKFRLMRYMVQVTEDATLAAGAVLTISLFDAAAGATGQAHDVWVPAAALALSGDLYTSPWVDIGNGFLSAAANNVLNVNLSAALVTGNVRVICCGTEE